jgi:hypothetical protein
MIFSLKGQSCSTVNSENRNYQDFPEPYKGKMGGRWIYTKHGYAKWKLSHSGGEAGKFDKAIWLQNLPLECKPKVHHVRYISPTQALSSYATIEMWDETPHRIPV